MTGLCFVDANVFVYAFDPRDPLKQRRATEWRDLLWTSRSGRTSVQALSETYATLGKLQGGRGSDYLWTEVSRYFAWDPMPVDAALLRQAREVELRWRTSWWDSLIVAAAQRQDCEVLLSEDFQDGMVFDSVTVRNPFTLEVRQPPARYEPVALAAYHRPRGRPRRTALA